MFSILSPRNSSRLWDNVEKCGTAMQATYGSITGRLRFSYLVNKLENRHTLITLNTYCFSTATVVTGTRLNNTWFVHCLSCCLLKLSEFIWKKRSVSLGNVIWWSTGILLYVWQYSKKPSSIVSLNY